MPRMTVQQMDRALQWVTYKPGWDLSLRLDEHEGPMLRIVAQVENAYRPGEMIDLGIDSYIPPLADEGAFYDWVLWRLTRVESHECREWYKVRGESWSDPHAIERDGVA